MPRFSANLGFLWAELPFLERFQAAGRAGFDAVEYMFPYQVEAEDLARLLRNNGLHQDLFNLPAGDFESGDRGVAAAPSRRAEFRAGVEAALRYAEALDCRKLNCLVGLRDPALAWEDQFACLIENLGATAERLAGEGRTLHVELLNTKETSGFFLDSVPLVERVLDEVGSTNLRFQFDVYHVQRTSGDLVATIQALAGRIGHYQVADVPGRHEPGTGEIAFPFVFEAIDASGYEGHVGLEYRPSAPTDQTFGWMRAYGYAPGSERGVREGVS